MSPDWFGVRVRFTQGVGPALLLLRVVVGEGMSEG